METQMVAPTIQNPVTHETIVFLETGRSTNGSLFKMDYRIGPRGAVAGEHRHPNQEMRIEVLSGTLTCTIEGKKHVLSPGDSATIPPGVDHHQVNDSDEELHAIEEYRPAYRMEEFLEVIFALARDGKTNRSGRPNLLRSAILFEEFEASIQVSSSFLNALFRLVAPVARAIGYRKELERYLEASSAGG